MIGTPLVFFSSAPNYPPPDTGGNQTQMKKELSALKAKQEEMHVFEEKIHHYADIRISIDLDDGVKHNYALFADVLAKLK